MNRQEATQDRILLSRGMMIKVSSQLMSLALPVPRYPKLIETLSVSTMTANFPRSNSVPSFTFTRANLFDVDSHAVDLVISFENDLVNGVVVIELDKGESARLLGFFFHHDHAILKWSLFFR